MSPSEGSTLLIASQGETRAFFLWLVVIGLLYMAHPDGRRRIIFIPVEAESLPHEGASALRAL